MQFKADLKFVLLYGLIFVAIVPTAQAADCFDRESEDPKAGLATATVGSQIILTRFKSDQTDISKGDKIFMRDGFTTGNESYIQLKFCDWSTYTLAANSEVQVSDIYDKKNIVGRRTVNYIRGRFRLVTGRNAIKNSVEVQIQEKGITMGVSGTDVILVDDGICVNAMLQGPGDKNDGAIAPGKVVFWKTAQPEDVLREIYSPGYMVCVQNEKVSKPFRTPIKLRTETYESFIPSSSDIVELNDRLVENPFRWSGLREDRSLEELSDLSDVLTGTVEKTPELCPIQPGVC